MQDHRMVPFMSYGFHPILMVVMHHFILFFWQKGDFIAKERLRDTKSRGIQNKMRISRHRPSITNHCRYSSVQNPKDLFGSFRLQIIITVRVVCTTIGNGGKILESLSASSFALRLHNWAFQDFILGKSSMIRRQKDIKLQGSDPLKRERMHHFWLVD